MTEKNYILIKGSQGIGNRIISILNMILFSKLTNRTLTVDWRDIFYSQKSINSFPQLFSCKNYVDVEQLPNTDSIFPSIWKGNIDKSINDMNEVFGKNFYTKTQKKYTFDISKIDYEYDILVSYSFTEKVYLLRKYFKNKLSEFVDKKIDEVFKTLLKNYIIFNPEIQNNGNKFIQQHFNDEVIGVHIRYTDRKSNIKKTLNTLNKLLKDKKVKKIFLATDNKKIIDLFKDQYSKNLIIRNKWLPNDPVPLHKANSDNNQVMHAIDAVTDMYLLSQSNYLVIDSRSSFSYISYLFSNLENSGVYDVRPFAWLPHSLRRKIFYLQTELNYLKHLKNR